MGWERSVVALAVASVMASGAVWACGGSDSSGVVSAGDGGNGDGATADAGDGGAPYTLDDVCARTGPILCNLRKPCCTETGGYDEQGCLAHESATCAKDVEAARGGRETFHPERIDPCVTKFQDLLSTCYQTFDVIFRAAKEFQSCQVFEGSLAEGASCERDSECKPSTATDFTSCDSTSKTCKTTHLAGEGETCSLGNGLSVLCNDGLFCDVDITSQQPNGTCKKSTPIGQACNTSKTFDLECQLGNYCDTSSGVCTKGKPASAVCKSDLECEALKCAGPDGGASDAGNLTCTAPAPLVKTEECKGP